MSVYVHCKTHRKRSGIEMNETLNLHRQRIKWTADIELDNNGGEMSALCMMYCYMKTTLKLCLEGLFGLSNLVKLVTIQNKIVISNL